MELFDGLKIITEVISTRTIYCVGSVWEKKGYQECDYLVTPLKHPSFLTEDECQKYINELDKKELIESLLSKAPSSSLEAADIIPQHNYYVKKHEIKY